jgi:hypothetical protein
MKWEDILTPYDLYEFMKRNIEYGFVSNYNYKIYTRKSLQNNSLYEKLLFESYYLQTPDELLKTKCGLCYDQVELARFWLEHNNYKVYTFFSKGHNHAFLIYEANGFFYLFERTFININGIHAFPSLESAINYYKANEALFNNKSIDDILVYPYQDVLFGCSFFDFIYYATKENKDSNVLKLVNKE